MCLAESEYCVIIPTYNNDQTLEGVISEVLKITGNIIVVNDGSTDKTAFILQQYNQLKIITYFPNRGKGYAIQKGFEKAMASGFRYAVTIDSDGQHYPSDIEILTQKAAEVPDSLIVGARNLIDEDLSGGSSFANRFSNFWFEILTGIRLPDTQTGFRLYPLDLLKNMRFFTSKYEFELEVLVRAAWKGMNIISAPVKVYYPSREQRISHFRPFRDFFRISILNTVFTFIALVYVIPFRFLKNIRKENIREFINKNIFLSQESNLHIALAISLGVFMGIIPVWGFQLILAITLAHLFGLSKLITAVAANISIPPMIPLLVYLSYITGGYILGNGQTVKLSSDLSVKSFEKNLLQYVIGSIVFAVIISALAGIISFFVLKVFRKKRMVTG